VSGVFDDLKYAVRAFGRAKATSAVLLLSLALGTGANATLFSVVDALLFRSPAGVDDAPRLAFVFTSQFNGALHGRTSYPDFTSLQGGTPMFEGLAAFDDSTLEAVRLGGLGQRARVAAVSPEFFPALRLSAQQGRLLPSDAPPEVIPAVISDSLWTALGRPADVIGQPLTVGGRAHVVVGVTPARFNGLQLGRPCDVWVPLPATIATSGRGDRRLAVIGRLRDGVRLAEAASAVDAIALGLARDHPETNRGTRSDADEPRRMTVVRFTRLDPSARDQVVLISAVILGATGLLLVSACVNAGNLLLSRSASRRRELAVKIALGAHRGRLVRQVIVESLLVSLSGAALGLLVAYWTSRVLPAFFAPEEAVMLDTSLDAMLVAGTVALSCVAGALFAIGPARHALNTNDAQVLRADAGGISERGGSTLRAAVVVAQVALSTVLLIGAGLIIRALSVALDGDLGPGGRGVAIALVRMPGAAQGDIVRGIVYHRAVEQQASKMQGAQAAGWVATLPVGRTTTQVFELEAGRPGLTERLEVDVNVATPGYFRAMRIPLVEGRFFDAGDGALADPVIIVNDILARRYFGDTAAGHRLRAGETTYEIVGVVRSGKYRTLQEAPEPMVYFPLSQRDQAYMHFVVRTEASPDGVVQALPDLLSSTDRGVEIKRTVTFDQHLAEALTLDRILTTIVAACGLAALILATIGVYGVVGDAVRRRTPEIGLRVALGARSTQILRLVFSEGVPLTMTGCVVGIVAAIALARLARSFVHALPGVDIASLAVVPLALLLVVVGAAAVPTRRALRVSPTIALRAE
jgi:macrolide transport system ATP-binding/permease protein